MTTDVAAQPSPPAAPQGLFRRHRVRIVLLGILAAGVGGAWLWIFAALKFSFSMGDRVGYVQKLSRRGWVCRTWEGELAMTPVPGAVPTIFAFTVPDPGVAKRLDELEGKKVSLHYEEKKGLPSSCFGDTRYFITDVRVLPQ
ncbi:MAG TPA: hypothetical protein VHL80_07975 [Polyangia bacterium]|nr:hypothetical protein [Polyangia bacterium]